MFKKNLRRFANKQTNKHKKNDVVKRIIKNHVRVI